MPTALRTETALLRLLASLALGVVSALAGWYFPQADQYGILPSRGDRHDLARLFPPFGGHARFHGNADGAIEGQSAIAGHPMHARGGGRGIASTIRACCAPTSTMTSRPT